MKRTITLLLSILFAGISISAQAADKIVAATNSLYADVAEKARLCETDDDQGQYGELVMNELTVNSRDHQWRAVGIYGQRHRFFYKGVEGDEKRLYPDQLVFVKSERRSSNRTYREEYLYSAAGALIYYIQRAENDEMVPAERRIYFSGPRAIRLIDDGKARDRMSKQDLAVIKEAADAGRKIKALFDRSIDL